MKKDEFLQLPSKEMWQRATDNLRNKKWTFQQFTAAVQAWKELDDQKKIQDEAETNYEYAQRIFG